MKSPAELEAWNERHKELEKETGERQCLKCLKKVEECKCSQNYH